MGDLLGPDPVLLPGDTVRPRPNSTPTKTLRSWPPPIPRRRWRGRRWPRMRWPTTRSITAYAYARTGYHRGLDQLRRNGWKGFGPVPVLARAQPGLPALCGRAGAGRRRDRRDRRICALPGSARRLRSGGARRTRPGLALIVGSADGAYQVASQLQSRRGVGWLDLDGRVFEPARGEHGACFVEHLGRVAPPTSGGR